MEIRQLLQTVRANWLVALVTFLLCLVLGGAYAVLPAKTYSTSVVLLAQPPPGASDPGTDVSAIQIEIPQITVEAENPTIDEEARAQLPARFQSVPVTIAATALEHDDTLFTGNVRHFRAIRGLKIKPFRHSGVH